MKGLSETLMRRLQQMLRQMDELARQLEAVTRAEYEAIRNMDGEKVLALADERVACHRALSALERDCRELLDQHGIDASMSLEAVIDLYAGADAGELQALRRNLYERILHVDRQGEENRIRMHAACNVSAAILHHLGLGHAEQTYGPRAGG